MSSVTEHYSTHLGPVYAWMAGGVDAAIARGAKEIETLGLALRLTGQVVAATREQLPQAAYRSSDRARNAGVARIHSGALFGTRRNGLSRRVNLSGEPQAL